MTDSWSFVIDILPSFGLRIGAALLCGILLGLERERKDKPAGLRTIVLITVGSTVYMLVSELIPLVTEGPESITRADPARIAAQVVSGVGFLGAGTIIQARGSVQGLTTAAVIWVSAGIGLCIGVGFPLIGIVITLLIMLLLILLDPLSTWISQTGQTRLLELTAPNDTLTLQRIDYMLKHHNIPERQIKRQILEQDSVQISIRYNDVGASSWLLLDALARIEGVQGVPASNA